MHVHIGFIDFGKFALYLLVALFLLKSFTVWLTLNHPGKFSEGFSFILY